MDDLPQDESAEDLELSLEDRVRDARHYAQRLERELRLFSRIVEALEAGRFISSTDRIKEYRELSRFQDTYEVLLRMMGHELRHHTTGFSLTRLYGSALTWDQVSELQGEAIVLFATVFGFLVLKKALKQ